MYSKQEYNYKIFFYIIIFLSQKFCFKLLPTVPKLQFQQKMTFVTFVPHEITFKYLYYMQYLDGITEIKKKLN